MKLTMKRWSWEILPCQDDRQVLEWSKKVIIPKKSRAGLNITHDASRCSAFILRRYRAENIDQKKKKITQRRQQCRAAAGAPADFHLNNQ